MLAESPRLADKNGAEITTMMQENDKSELPNALEYLVSSLLLQRQKKSYDLISRRWNDETLCHVL